MPTRLHKKHVEDEPPFPRPERPAGAPEVAMAIWWAICAVLVLGMWTAFWATTWPTPTGVSALRANLEYGLPIGLAAVSGFLALVVGLGGMVKQKLRPAQRTPAMAHRRAAARA